LFRRATDEQVEHWRSAQRDEKGATAEPRDVDSQPAAKVACRSTGTGAKPAEPQLSTPEDQSEWHTEAHVQSALVTALVTEGWRILSVANTATKEHGIDVVAARDGQTIGVEVKGFPSRRYADPARATETKRTTPSTQAGHWYAQAVLAAMRLRSKQPTWRSVIVLPDFPRYRELHTQTEGSLAAALIEVWWIDQMGTLHSA
jgi:Holliday junction resolvase-like predicted endonuclease